MLRFPFRCLLFQKGADPFDTLPAQNIFFGLLFGSRDEIKHAFADGHPLNVFKSGS